MTILPVLGRLALSQSLILNHFSRNVADYWPLRIEDVLK
jgi:hypothetical protein